MSNDGHRFGGHISNLATFSEGFPPTNLPFSSSASCVSSDTEEVKLGEEGDVLNLLLQYMHSDMPPDISALPFDTLLRFAHAAYKYVVYHAVHHCATLLKYATFEYLLLPLLLTDNVKTFPRLSHRTSPHIHRSLS